MEKTRCYLKISAAPFGRAQIEKRSPIHHPEVSGRFFLQYVIEIA